MMCKDIEIKSCYGLEMVTGVLDWLGPVRDNTEHVDIGGRT